MSLKEQKAKRIAQRKRQELIKKISLVSLGVLVLAGLVAFVYTAARPAPKVPVEVNGSPSLKVDKEEIQMGDIKLGTTVRAEFKLSNVGDQPLKITEQPYIEVIEGC